MRPVRPPSAARLAPLLALGAVLAGAQLAGPARAQDPPQGDFGPEVWAARQDGVPVRSDPGFLYRALTHLKADAEVLVDRRQGQWLHVRPEGWVLIDHVRPKGDPPARAAAAGKALVVTRDGARVRQGPGTDQPVVATLDSGARVLAVGERDGWWELDSGGWLYQQLARPDEGAPAPRARSSGPVGAAATATADDSERIVAAPVVNLRATPDKASRIVGQLRQGQAVTVGQAVDGWIEVPGQGWAQRDLLARPEDMTAPGTIGPVPDRQAPLEGASPRRWSLMDLNGIVFEVGVIDPRSPFLEALRKELRSTGFLEDDWTILRLLVIVPQRSPFRFNYSADHNSVMIIDSAGARYANVYPRGSVDVLPVHLRPFFMPVQVQQGQVYEGVLLFRPTLKPASIREVWMYVGGRMQRLYEG